MRRKLTDEIMDSPGLDESAHVEALEALRRINRASQSAATILEPILRFARQRGLSKLSLLDIACGGGDVPIEIVTRAARKGVEIQLTLMDRSQTALNHASALARKVGIEVATILGDATLAGIPDIFDVVTNSLFLHHLTTASAIAALSGMRERSRHLVVINDLRRSWTGWLWAWIGCRLVTRSPIVHHDGPVSVEGAWTKDEMRMLVTEAGMSNSLIRSCYPWRMLIVWDRNDAR
jgi:2-polyprenyl-3-methyl-5-hydroxy-6-metoxy-1,4-benzoquinol methylase